MSERVSMPNLVKQLTVEQIEDIREIVISLNEGLEQLPKTFDKSFKEKINTILDITKEIEKHSINLKSNILESQKVQNSIIMNKLNDFQKENIKTITESVKKSQPSKLNLFLIIFIASCITDLCISAAFISMFLFL